MAALLTAWGRRVVHAPAQAAFTSRCAALSNHSALHLHGPVFSRLLATSPSRPVASDVLRRLGIEPGASIPGVFNGKWGGSGPELTSANPATNDVLARVTSGTEAELNETLNLAKAAQAEWREVPAPKRGDVVRQIREALYANKADLGALVSLEVGKILPEGLGEIQEYIDVADFALGLSRALNGQVIPSERPGHFMMEQFHPLGVVGVISAFNFPVAVAGWNVALALVTGNATVWKPAPSTPLTAVAVSKLIQRVLEDNGYPGALHSLVCGGADVGQAMALDSRVDLLSFTGSTE
ncbi:Alpha-aminoadipic semialdehyde dehydrogenase, partial [Cladochytrium tenue]